MFVGVEDEAEAFYLCGVLSSDPIRWKVTAYAAGTQISANAIEPLGVARFDQASRLHVEISQACRAGHRALSEGSTRGATEALMRINIAAASLFGVDDVGMREFRAELERVHRTDWQPLHGA
jgi:hypothetical protein